MSTIARFRMSSHTLAIETGRHAKPKIAKEERKCRCCNLDYVEDEKHFLLKCPLYNEERLPISISLGEASVVAYKSSLVDLFF